MTEQNNDMRGAIWANDRKDKETHPDFRGQAMINGVEYWVSAWRRKPDANPKAPALSFSFQEKEEKPSDNASYHNAEAQNNINDEIPF
jgi:hypothetical protein